MKVIHSQNQAANEETVTRTLFVNGRHVTIHFSDGHNDDAFLQAIKLRLVTSHNRMFTDGGSKNG